MEIETLVVGVLETNCYIVHDNKQAIIIDPGSDAKKIIKIIEEKNLQPKLIVNTHYHFDHTGANLDIKIAFNIPIAIGINDAKYLEDAYLDAHLFMIDAKKSPKADILLKENDEIELNNIKLIVIETPGHTIGSICLFNKDNHVLFSGDTLFYESIGRYDLPTGNYNQLMKSLKKILTLDDECVVYPGHGPKTTIKHELSNNPFIQ
ncbi:Glyoxylase, beta-lactamase superfamily II [Desulfurella multipotens]|uniref:Glyoxylase, beta-lactamase superfamily II n=2 Tax=Desulfurellaceae TaxID=117942 RepID=A0A1G6JUW1_9BACT|nr:MBL fold metallo-hydrolase [Desulfurella multipotens]SDC22448.1 Glyoxylase, beta-lactamase superfamily II [Desulfurella multipotens]